MHNIFLVTADSLRADHCGWLGGANTTNYLDRLATDSLDFRTAISPGPRTLSSIPVSHTGVHFPITDHDTNNYQERIARIQNHIQRFDTISEILQDQGYTTIAFTANPWTSEDSGFDKGFNTFQETSKDGGSIEQLFENTPLKLPAKYFDQWWHKDSWFSQWRPFYDDIVERVEDTKKPIFCWVFLMDTHNPYIVPKQDREESSTYEMYAGNITANRAVFNNNQKTGIAHSVSEKTISRLEKAYRDSVRSIDGFVEELCSDLISPNDILIFHSDHGEAFGKHGTFGHTQNLYEENIHVPFLVYGTDSSDQVNAPLSTRLLPEIAHSCAIKGEVDIESWTSDYVYAKTEDSNGIAVRGRRWKYISNDGENLFDLEADPEEKNDLSDERQDILDRFRDLKEDHLASLPEPNTETAAVESEEMRNHLESLGYLSGDQS